MILQGSSALAAPDIVLTVLVSVPNFSSIVRPNCLKFTRQFTADGDFDCFPCTMITFIVIFVVDLLPELVL